MAGTYRPAAEARRHSSDIRDRSRERDPRDRNQRDRDFRDRGRDRSRDRSRQRRGSFSRDDSSRAWERPHNSRPNNSSRELFNMKPNRAATKRTNSAQSSPAHRGSDQASIISNISSFDGNAAKHTPNQHVKRFTDIMCKKLHWYTQREDVSQKQKKLQEDIKRFDSRRSEFGSLHSTHERQLESLGVHKKSCTQHVESADQELLPAFQALLNSLLETRKSSLPPAQAGEGPSQPAQAKEGPSQPIQPKPQESHTKSMASDLEPRLMELQKRTAESFQIQLALEINKVREEFRAQHDSKFKALEESLEKARAQLKQEAQERQLFKTRLDALSQRVNRDREEAIQKSNVLDERITKKLDKVSQILDSKNPEIKKERVQSEEAHAKKTNNQVQNLVANCCKRVDEVEKRMDETRKPVDEIRKEVDEVRNRLTTLESDVPGIQFQNEQNAELHGLLEKQNQRFSPLQGQLDAAVGSVNELQEELSEQSQKTSTQQGRLDAGIEKVEALEQGLSKQSAEMEQTSSKLKAIEDHVMSLKENLKKDLNEDLRKVLKEARDGDTTDISHEDIEGLRTEILGHTKAIKAHEEKQDLANKDIILLKSTLSGLSIDELKQLSSEISKIKQKLETYSGSSRASPAQESQTNLVTKKVLEEFQSRLEQRISSKLKNLAQGIAGPVERVEKGNHALEYQFKSLDTQVSALNSQISANEQKAEGQIEKHNRWLSDFDIRLQQQIDDNKVRDEGLAWVKAEVGLARQEGKLGHEDLQMQVSNLNGWVSNFNSQTLYDSMTNRVYQSISKGVPGLVDKLSARVEVLEAKDEGPLLKKRKASNAGAVAVNGNH